MKYVIGARIHSESETVKEWILGLDKQTGKFHEKERPDGSRLIIGYSRERAKKDAHNRENNKFLEISKDVEVVDQYHGLWVVERAFRVTKGNIEARPVFHFTEKRIEAHICICFIAYKVYKELERIIKLAKIAKIDKSVDAVLKIAKTIATIRINMPNSGTVKQPTLFLTPAHQEIKPLFDIDGILKEDEK